MSDHKDLIERMARACDVEFTNDYSRNDFRRIIDTAADAIAALVAERDAAVAVINQASNVLHGGEGVTDQGEAYDRALKLLDAARQQGAK